MCSFTCDEKGTAMTETTSGRVLVFGDDMRIFLAIVRSLGRAGKEVHVVPFDWHAPALTALSSSPVPWTTTALFDYLRNGYSREHGVAGGSMTQVVKSLANVSDDDIQAMATYLASFSVPLVTTADQAAKIVAAADLPRVTSQPHGERLFQGACSSCHHTGDGPKLLGLNIPLALATSMHADTPNNLIRTIFDGVRSPAHRDIGFMAGFRDHFNNAQMTDLVAYLRERFAPGRSAWSDVPETVNALRQAQP